MKKKNVGTHDKRLCRLWETVAPIKTCVYIVPMATEIRQVNSCRAVVGISSYMSAHTPEFVSIADVQWFVDLTYADAVKS